MNIEQRLKDLGLTLPPAPPAGGIYKPVVISGNMLFVSGQGPVRTDGSLITGRLGTDLEVEEGYAAARQVALTMLATINAQTGNLGILKRLVKTLGMVNSAPSFTDHPKVINGFSELMGELMGKENGIGARSAVGMILPGGIAVEIEAIFEINE